MVVSTKFDHIQKKLQFVVGLKFVVKYVVL